MRPILFTLLLLLPDFAALSQDLVGGLRKSPYTYIYALSNEEAAHAYADQLQSLRPGYTQVLVDSFPTGKFYPKTLAFGNYLFLHVDAEKLVMRLESVRNVSISVLPDVRQLMATVYDTAGAMIKDATAILDGKPLRFDAVNHVFRRKFFKPLEGACQGLKNRTGQDRRGVLFR